MHNGVLFARYNTRLHTNAGLAGRTNEVTSCARSILAAKRAFTCRMDARRPFYIAPSRVPLRPLARLAARFLGPGPMRLRMVLYVHELDREQPEAFSKGDLTAPGAQRARAA